MDLKLQTLRREVKQFGKDSARLTRRFLALIELTKFRSKHGCVRESDYASIGARLEISGRTLYRWEAAYKRGGAPAMRPIKAPGRRARAIRGHTAKKIVQMRKLYCWGAEVIQAHLKHDYGVERSQYEINRLLRRKGLLVRKKCKQRQRHTRVVDVKVPGQHTQTDVKHLPHLLPKRRKCYVYNFVDHASKWAFKRAYDSYGPSETRDFMHAVVQAAPFMITRSQTDNGLEFTNKYTSHVDEPREHALDKFCASHGIRHVLIPPGEKELQGLVERSHRQDDEELFHRITPMSLEAFNAILSEHCKWRNAKRRRKLLGWKTSDEFLKNYRLQTEIEEREKIARAQAENQTTEESADLVKKAA